MLFPMDRRRSTDGSMATVLARLVRLLAILCLSAGVAVVAHACVWAMLSFTEVREHGLVAVTHPERVVEMAARSPASSTDEAVGTIVSVKAASNATHDAVINEADEPLSDADAAAAFHSSSTADSWLGFIAGAATVVGVATLALLPIVLFVAFVTALVRAPRAAGPSMGGVLWSIGLLALVLPWASIWPQIPWSGLFLPYGSLVAQVNAIHDAGGPFAFGPLVAHVIVPALTIAVLVGIAWRCGEPLHAELLTAEALNVDSSLELDASQAAARGAGVPAGRAAAGLSMATGSPVRDGGMTSDRASDAPSDAERPRRLI